MKADLVYNVEGCDFYIGTAWLPEWNLDAFKYSVYHFCERNDLDQSGNLKIRLYTGYDIDKKMEGLLSEISALPNVKIVRDDIL